MTSVPSSSAGLSVCVFCSSRFGEDPVHREAADALGAGLAAAGMRLVYGGGRVGLMGVVADAALAGGARVVGVIPEFLRAREVAHGNVGELIVTDSMHSRKRRMFELSDAFVTMPGGFGTMDEFFEIVTWRQLGLHDKPILLCDVAGWGGAVMGLVDGLVRAGFVDARTAAVIESLPGVPAVLDRLARTAKRPAPATGKL